MVPVNRPQFWKDELARENTRLRRLLGTKGVHHVVERTMALEKFAFVTAYGHRGSPRARTTPSPG